MRGLKVVAWPACSTLDPTEAELRHVDSAMFREATDGFSRCTYTLPASGEQGIRDRACYGHSGVRSTLTTPTALPAVHGETGCLGRECATRMPRICVCV
ncbi:DUF5707 domain-containing protein [Streptomyces bobili]|uniref:DUF5707 domain-containing protein n=1 Tax=Streptomyces bobili TaxID=67280 RepID=UPI0038262E1D